MNQTTITLAQGTHAHVLHSPKVVQKTEINISGNAPLTNFLVTITEDSTIKHETPVKGHSQVRVPHAEVIVKPGVHERSIAIEYNPFTEKSMENYD